MNQKYEIEIEGKGNYENRSTFKRVTGELTQRQYLGLVAVVLTFLEENEPQGETANRDV